MEAARTSSGSGTRHRRCRCCLPALTGFTTSRRGEADASHHGRARDGQHDVKTGKKTGPPPRGDAILPHWGGREFFAAATACTLAARVAIRSVLADGIRSRQWGVDRASEAPRARIDGVGARAFATNTMPLVAGRKHQHGVGARRLNVTADRRRRQSAGGDAIWHQNRFF